MKTDVLIEKKENKLVITLDKDAEYADIKEKLAQILKMSGDTFAGIVGPITIKGRRLLDDEENEIMNMISEKTDLAIRIEKPKQMGLATIDNIFGGFESRIADFFLFTAIVSHKQMHGLVTGVQKL